MRINWGWGIVIAFVLFISFIMYFIVKMTVDKQYEHDMVTDNYYKKEAEFQEKIDRQSATNMARMEVHISSISEGILLEFPEKLHNEKVPGKVSFYRPSDKTQDFEVPLEITDGKMLVPGDKVSGGRWDVEVYYQYGGGDYMSKEKIMR